MSSANNTYAFPALDIAATAPNDMTAGDVTARSGGCLLWLTTTASGEIGTARAIGAASLTCATGVAIDAGDLVYWNATTGVTETNTDTPLGVCLEDKAAGAGLNLCQVYMNGFES